MALRLRLKPFEKVIINGCVVTNGNRRNTVTVANFGHVIKSKDIMQPEEATTPYRKLYFMVQTMLIDAPNAQKHMNDVNAHASKLYVDAAEGERAEIMRAMDYVHVGDFYKALTAIKTLIPEGWRKDGANGDAPGHGDGNAGQKSGSVFTYSVGEPNHADGQTDCDGRAQCR